MQKKALLVAVGMALAVQGAWGQKKEKPDPDSVVELYGKVYPEFYIPDSSGATAAGVATCTICTPAAGESAVVRRTMIESSNSRFGVRGHDQGRGHVAGAEIFIDRALDERAPEAGRGKLHRGEHGVRVARGPRRRAGARRSLRP